MNGDPFRGAAVTAASIVVLSSAALAQGPAPQPEPPISAELQRLLDADAAATQLA